MDTDVANLNLKCSSIFKLCDLFVLAGLSKSRAESALSVRVDNRDRTARAGLQSRGKPAFYNTYPHDLSFLGQTI